MNFKVNLIAVFFRTNYPTSVPPNKAYFDADGLEYNEDNSEFDLNESATYFSKFLLRRVVFDPWKDIQNGRKCFWLP